MSTATGIGSWPGTDIRETLRVVRDAAGDAAPHEGEPDWLPYLPELPGRGPGADLIGRATGLLVGLPVDLQPMGWRLVDRPGMDARRTGALWHEDLDELAEAFDGWDGRLKVQVCGPWTLASSIWLHRGERVVVDPGASRDLVDSLAEGVRLHLEQVRRLVPQAAVVLQLDEPALPAVLAGRLPTASGYGMIRALEPEQALAGLERVLAAAGKGETVVHCCAADPPLPLLRRSGADVATDTSLLSPLGWEGVAVGVESGMTLYAGCVPTSEPAPRARAAAEALASRWHELGMPASTLDDVVLSPSCGMAALTPQAARDVQRLSLDMAKELTDIAHD